MSRKLQTYLRLRRTFRVECGRCSRIFSCQHIQCITKAPDSWSRWAKPRGQPQACLPPRGSLLASLVQTPDLTERIGQGGVVGYVIVVLGILGVGLAVWRMAYLFSVGAKMRAQQGSEKPDLSNPLGRVMQVYAEHKEADVETLELKLDEAILREVPSLESGNTLIKTLGAVAPLLGLLGTVTGMIRTFQAITLFGTGDPKLMAGGISTALVTTVLGLVAAIPLLLLHSVVAGRSKAMVQILEEQSAGLVARQAEREAKKG